MNEKTISEIERLAPFILSTFFEVKKHAPISPPEDDEVIALMQEILSSKQKKDSRRKNNEETMSL